MICGQCQQPLTACRCGDEQPQASVRNGVVRSRPAEAVLLPALPVTLNMGWGRSVTVVLKPFTLRQLRQIGLGLSDSLSMAAGLSQKQLRKVLPQSVAQLQTLIAAVNHWDPSSLADALEDGKQVESTSTLHDFAPELVAAGHDAAAIWDYTPEQFCFYLRKARQARLESHREFCNGIAAAISSAVSKEGTKLFEKYVGAINNAIKETQRG